MTPFAFLPLVGDILDKIFPDKTAAEAAKVRLLELTQSGELAKLESSIELAKGQLEVNKAEAVSDGLYKGGWRPAIGYVCATALAYNYVVYPILVFIMSYAMPEVEVPQVNIDENLWELITGMLGLGAMRTWEKIKR